MIAKKYIFKTKDRNWPQYVLKLKNVYVLNDGLIVDEDGDIIPEANFNYLYWKNPATNFELRGMNKTDDERIFNSLDTVTKPISFDRIPRAELEKGVCVMDDHNYVFAVSVWGQCYVWGELWDSIRPLNKINSLNIDNPSLACSRFTSHVNQLPLHFKAFGYRSDNIDHLLEIDKKKYFFRTLYYPSPTGMPAGIDDNSIDYLRHGYFSLINSDDYDNNDLSLYLSRGDSDHGKRGVTNEQEIIDYCKDNNIIVVTGKEGLIEHIQLFRRAKKILGPHGSLFRNIIFCKRSPSVLEICPENRQNKMQKGIGDALGIDYEWRIAPSSKKFNIDIPLSVIKSFYEG